MPSISVPYTNILILDMKFTCTVDQHPLVTLLSTNQFASHVAAYEDRLTLIGRIIVLCDCSGLGWA